MQTRPALRIAVAVAALVACAVIGCRSTSGPASEPEPADVYRLDRSGFIQELVFARATPRTLRFDDYTTGSYHVDKLDLLEGVRDRKASGTPIVALLVRGPSGPLWVYDICLFIREGEGVRVNSVWMPHARITHKSTSLISVIQFDQLRSAIRHSDALQRGVPTLAETLGESSRNPVSELEWSYDLLFADFSEAEELYHSKELYGFSNDPPESVVALRTAIAQLLANDLVTYSSDISDEESVYRRLDAP